MKEQIIILNAKPYQFTDEQTGRTVEGVSMLYTMAKDLMPNGENEFLGVRIMKDTITKDNIKEMRGVPGYYECEFDIRPERNGKASLRPSKVKFLKPVQ